MIMRTYAIALLVLLALLACGDSTVTTPSDQARIEVTWPRAGALFTRGQDVPIVWLKTPSDIGDVDIILNRLDLVSSPRVRIFTSVAGDRVVWRGWWSESFVVEGTYSLTVTMSATSSAGRATGESGAFYLEPGVGR